jgi:hypothetical protein
MARPLEIKRIDLLVHPFYREKPRKYRKKNALFLLDLWRKHVDEVAAGPTRLLLIAPIAGQRRGLRKKLTKALQGYAKTKLGKRFGFFQKKGNLFLDCQGQSFLTFEEFMKANGFTVEPSKVKTRALGEWTNVCMANYLTRLNREIGMPNPIPYRNRQSTILPRKSIAYQAEYPMPWQLKELNKTAAGREKLKRWMQKYIVIRRKKAKDLGAKDLEKRFIFRPMQRKRPR